MEWSPGVGAVTPRHSMSKVYAKRQLSTKRQRTALRFLWGDSAPAHFKRLSGVAADLAMAFLTEDRVRAAHAHPTQSHGRNPSATGVTVLVIPGSLLKREARCVEGLALVEDEEAMSPSNREPAAVALSREGSLDDRLLLLSSGHKRGDRVECRNAPRLVLIPPELGELLFGHCRSGDEEASHSRG